MEKGAGTKSRPQFTQDLIGDNPGTGPSLDPEFSGKEEHVILGLAHRGMAFGAEFHPCRALAAGHAEDGAIGHDHRVPLITGGRAEARGHLLHHEKRADADGAGLGNREAVLRKHRAFGHFPGFFKACVFARRVVGVIVDQPPAMGGGGLVKNYANHRRPG